MSNPIRVLHVVTQMACGGLETMIMNYYRKIDKSKVQFDFLTHRPITEKKDYDDEIQELGGKIYHISRLNPFSLSYRKELEKFFDEHKEYQIIHVHLDCMSGLVLKAAEKKGIPIRIAHCHSSSQDKNILYLIKLMYKKLIPRYATGLFSCGETAGEWMFGKNEKFIVLPNAIDTDKYVFSSSKREYMREKLGLPNDAFVIGHVGRFSEVKNHRFIIELSEKFLKKNENTYILLAGQGNLMGEMKKVVSEKGLDDSISFLGLRNDIPDIMQAIDVFILPSLYEGLPVSVIEAQAAGLPCLISKNVPLDCAITNLVTQVELDIPKWENALNQVRSFKRRNTQEEIKNARFDIKENAIYLENYYLSNLASIAERK